MMPVQDWQTGAYFCWCGSPLAFRTAAAAVRCTHPAPVAYTPGIPYTPTRPVPSTVSALAMAPRRRRWPEVALALTLGALAVAIIVGAGLLMARANPAPAPVSTPTTYGPPGPRGGPVIPARPMPRWSR